MKFDIVLAGETWRGDLTVRRPSGGTVLARNASVGRVIADRVGVAVDEAGVRAAADADDATPSEDGPDEV